LPPSEVLSCSPRGPPPPSRRAARPGSRGRRDSGSASRAVSSCPSSERLGLDVMREAIRRQADLMVAQVDLWTLLDREPDQAMAIEAAKGQLTPDQRSKLTALLAGGSSGQADPPGTGEPPSGARGAGPAPAGGAGSRPPAGPPPEGRHFEGHRQFDQGRGFIGVEPFWWGARYRYWSYPSLRRAKGAGHCRP